MQCSAYDTAPILASAARLSGVIALGRRLQPMVRIVAGFALVRAQPVPLTGVFAGFDRRLLRGCRRGDPSTDTSGSRQVWYSLCGAASDSYSAGAWRAPLVRTPGEFT